MAAYRTRRITNPKAHDVVIKAVDCRAITPSQVPEVLHQWRTPDHADFQPRNAWSLFNACTEVSKGITPHTVVNRSQALHELTGLSGEKFAEICFFNLAAPSPPIASGWRGCSASTMDTARSRKSSRESSSRTARSAWRRPPDLASEACARELAGVRPRNRAS